MKAQAERNPAGTVDHSTGIAAVTPALVYFSNYSGNTQRFIEKVITEIQTNGHTVTAHRIPIQQVKDETLQMEDDYILVVPTYGGGSDTHAVPRQVIQFLNNPSNRAHLIGIVGTGNTNFGADYCKAARIIAQKTGAPILDRIEILGTPAEVTRTAQLFASGHTRQHKPL